METLVPDASIILKWSLEREEEPDFPKAFLILRDYLEEKIDICLPSLWRYEVGNVLGRKKPGMAKEIFSVLLSYQFDEEPLEEEYGFQVFELMKKLKKASFYDAAYHILATRKQGLYVTADQGYYRLAVNEGHIRLLSER